MKLEFCGFCSYYSLMGVQKFPPRVRSKSLQPLPDPVEEESACVPGAISIQWSGD